MKQHSPYDEEDLYGDESERISIDWSRYIQAARRYRKRILLVTGVFAVLSVIIALCQQRVYRVAVTLAPEITNSRSSSSLGSLASLIGLNASAGAVSADAFNITIFPDIAQSTPFLTQLFTVQLAPQPKLPKDPIEARKVLEGPLPTVCLYDHVIGLDREPGLMKRIVTSLFGEKERDPEYLKVNPSLLTKEQEGVVKYLQKHISVSVEKKTAMTTILVSLDDPMMCAQLADTVCRHLRDYVFAYRTEKERNTLSYYEALCDSTYQTMVAAQTAYAANLDNDHSIILQSVNARRQRLQQEAEMASQVYQTMVQQREMSRARLQQLKPVFAVVQPAVTPLRPANSRRNTCIVITFIGLLFSSLWYIVLKDWIADRQKSMNATRD